MTRLFSVTSGPNFTHTIYFTLTVILYSDPNFGRLCCLVDSALDHISLPPGFESRRGHTWKVFHLWFRFITFGCRSAHLAYLVQKSARKTSIIIIIIIIIRYKFWTDGKHTIKIPNVGDDVIITYMTPKAIMF